MRTAKNKNRFGAWNTLSGTFLLMVICSLFLALHACDRGGGGSITGLEGDPVKIKLLPVPAGRSASQATAPEYGNGCAGEGCDFECDDEGTFSPKYLEIIISVNGGDPRTIYNGPFQDPITLPIPNGTVAICAIINNCDCCELFRGEPILIELPEDGGTEQEITMIELDLTYQDWQIDRDNDSYADQEYACQRPGDGWISGGNMELDCDDDDPEVGPAGNPVFIDADGDGFGAGAQQGFNCPTEGQVLNNDDCDDGDLAVNPDATEICNDDIDNDCDNLTDCLDTADCDSAPNCEDPCSLCDTCDCCYNNGCTTQSDFCFSECY